MLKEKPILRASLALSGFKIYQLIAAFLTSILLARSLGADGYGAYCLVISVVGALVLPVCSGFKQLLVRQVAIYEQRDLFVHIGDIQRWSERKVLAIVITVSVGLFVYAALTAQLSAANNSKLFMLAAPVMPILALMSLRQAVLQGLRKVVQAGFCDAVILPSLLLFFALGFQFSGKLSPHAAILSYVISIAFCLFWVNYILKGMQRAKGTVKFNIGARAEWARKIWPFSAMGAVSYISVEVFTPLIALYGGNEQVAIFRVAMNFSVLIGLPLALVESVIHPHIARLFEAKEVIAIKSVVFKAGVSVFVVSAPLFILLYLFGEILIARLYGNQYIDAHLPLIIISFSFLAVNLIGPSMVMLYATAYEVDALIISAAGLVLTLILCSVLIPSYGTVGAALSFGAGKIIRAAAYSVCARFRLSRYL